MSQDLLTAIKRTEKPNNTRKNGYVPGVVYGKSMSEPLSVKFEMKDLRGALDRNKYNSITKIKFDNDVKQCIIKDVQRDVRTGNIIHIDFQAAAADDTIKLKIPIVYNGKEWLDNQGLILETLSHEIEISGKAGDIPAMIEINLDGKLFGDKIIVSDIKLDKGIEIISSAEDMIAVITVAKKPQEQTAEEA